MIGGQIVDGGLRILFGKEMKEFVGFVKLRDFGFKSKGKSKDERKGEDEKGKKKDERE